MQLTSEPAVDTSVSSKGFVTDNVHWIGEYPKEIGFVTYVDATGGHLLYHGDCGGRPQFLSDDLILEPGCKDPFIINTQGYKVRTLAVGGRFSFAGVSQNRNAVALQIGKFSSSGSLEKSGSSFIPLKVVKRLPKPPPSEPARGTVVEGFFFGWVDVRSGLAVAVDFVSPAVRK